MTFVTQFTIVSSHFVCRVVENMSAKNKNKRKTGLKQNSICMYYNKYIKKRTSNVLERCQCSNFQSLTFTIRVFSPNLLL
jgi:hypothetical protein